MKPLSLVLAASCLLAPSAAVHAQAGSGSALGRVPLTIAVRVPAARPALSVGDFLLQAGGGAVGGLAGMFAVGVPLMMANWSTSSPVSEDLVVGLIAGAYVAGTTAGVHYVGRRQDMRANPFATVGGALVGLVLAGATVQADEEGYAEPNPLIFIAPALGGATGHALTRRAR
jgi:hypothetical protein